MKTATISHRIVLCLCLVFLCGAAAILGALGFFDEPRKTEGSFFEIAGFLPEDVDNITICHQDSALNLSEQNQKRLLDSLTTTQGQLLEYDHEYPYHLTQFPLQFHVKGKVIEYPIAWFTGYENVIQGSGDLAKYTSLIQYVDRRVDVQIEGQWFTFQQTGEAFWNEDISNITYGTASRQDPTSAANASMGGSQYVKDQPDFRDPMYYIDAADLVVLAKHTSREYIISSDSWNEGCQIPHDHLEIIEVLKGEYDSEDVLTFTDFAPTLDAEGNIYKSPFGSAMKGGVDGGYAYFSEPGDTYLLFLYEADYLTHSEFRPLLFYEYWLAKVYNDTAYACVNHEKHAFFEMPLEEIRTLCEASDDHGFFAYAGFAPEDVQTVMICHQGTSVEISEGNCQRLLDSLTSTLGERIFFEHEYPYQVSEYQIQFHLNDRVVEYPFSWFSGFQQEPSMTYVDRRVDVQINNEWLSFEQLGEDFWNEDISILSFHSALPTDTDRSDFDTRALADQYPGSGLSMYWEPSYYIYQSDLIVTAVYQETATSPSAESIDHFEVQEVLQGDFDTVSSLQCFSSSLIKDTFKPGTTYLLFLDYDHITHTYSYIEPGKPYSWLAAVYNDTAYACVNRETYAFFCMPLDRLREDCNYYVLSTADLQALPNELPIYEPADAADFAATSIQACLMEAESENLVFSPTNLYTQLSLLTGATGGNSRAQILTVLGASDMNAIRSRQASFYSTDLLRRFNSVWINTYSTPSFLSSLAQQHYTSVYNGHFDASISGQAIYNWSADRSRYFIQDHSLPELTLSSDQNLLLAGTLYLDSAWTVPFSANCCTQETFYSPGGEMECDFMHQTEELNYYEGTHFTAVSKSLASGGEVLFVLPNADSSIDLLLEESEVLDLMVSDLRDVTWPQHQTCTVNFSLPKLVINNAVDLTKPLQEMGITDIFDPQLADFSPFSYSSDLFLSQLLHIDRVMINPEGCVREYEEYDPMNTVAFEKGEGIDFILDRPFIFTVTDPEGMPVYAGVINQPKYITTHVFYDRNAAE